jgi:zinc and cadmium transporter
MDASILSLLSVILVSLISFVGVLTLVTRFKAENRLLAFLVSFAAGALLGDVFIHLLPELAAEGQFNATTSAYVLAAIILLFIIEKYIHWHHHGIEDDDKTKHAQPFVFTNLIGDGLHNMIDGMVITGSYLLDIRLGIATTIAVILHEIPQEFADFGVLIYGGLKPSTALYYNFLSARRSVGSGLWLKQKRRGDIGRTWRRLVYLSGGGGPDPGNPSGKRKYFDTASKLLLGSCRDVCSTVSRIETRS